MTTNFDTTMKTRGALSSVPTDLQTARNRLAVAIKNHTTEPSPVTLEEVQSAQAEVFKLEDQYRDAYRLLLEHTCSKQKRGS